MIENDIVQDPEIATGKGHVPDPHSTGAIGDQGLHSTDEDVPDLVPVPHVGIGTTGAAPVLGHGPLTRGGERETGTEGAREKEIERGIVTERGREEETVVEIVVGPLGGGRLPRVLIAPRRKSQSKSMLFLWRSDTFYFPC